MKMHTILKDHHSKFLFIDKNTTELFYAVHIHLKFKSIYNTFESIEITLPYIAIYKRLYSYCLLYMILYILKILLLC